MHISERHHFTVHTFTSVVTTEVDGVAIEDCLFGDGRRSDTVWYFRLYRMLLAEASAPHEDRNTDTGAQGEGSSEDIVDRYMFHDSFFISWWGKDNQKD